MDRKYYIPSTLANREDYEWLAIIATGLNEKLQLGDEARKAWGELVCKHEDKLMGLLYWVVYREGWIPGLEPRRDLFIEQLKDETFDKAKDKAGKYQQRSKVITWLCGIGRNIFWKKFNLRLLTYDQVSTLPLTRQIEYTKDSRQFDMTNETATALTANHKVLRRYLHANYTADEIDLFMTCAKHMKDGSDKMSLPKEEIQRFRKMGYSDNWRRQVFHRFKIDFYEKCKELVKLRD